MIGTFIVLMSHYCSAATVVLPPLTASSVQLHPLTFSAYTGAPITIDRVNEWISYGAAALQSKDADFDVICPMSLSWNQTLGAIDSSFQIMNDVGGKNDAQTQALLNLGRDVYIVNTISKCGGAKPPTGSGGASFAGCGGIIDGRGIIVLALSGNIDDITLTHEFGHYQHLDDIHDSEIGSWLRWIMYERANQFTSDIVNGIQCYCFLNRCVRPPPPPMLAGGVARPIEIGIPDEFLVSLGTAAVPLMLVRLREGTGNPVHLVEKIGAFADSNSTATLSGLQAYVDAIVRSPRVSDDGIVAASLALGVIGSVGRSKSLPFLERFLDDRRSKALIKCRGQTTTNETAEELITGGAIRGLGETKSAVALKLLSGFAKRSKRANLISIQSALQSAESSIHGTPKDARSTFQ